MAVVLATPDLLAIIDSGFCREQELPAALSRLGLQPDDFDLVINTHVHPDHAGNNVLFTRARILVSRVDYVFNRNFSHALIAAHDPVAVYRSFYTEADDRRLESHAWQARRLAQDYWRDDIIGRSDQVQWLEDGPDLPSWISCLATPGHTPGHYSVQLHTQPPVLITGDAMASRRFWKTQLTELSHRYSNREYLASKANLEQFDGLVIAGHDRPFWSENRAYCKDEEIILHAKKTTADEETV